MHLIKTSLVLLLFLIINQISFGQIKSDKRGVAYGNHSASDMQTASKGISWWYNWTGDPEYAIITTYANYNVDFTPMAWNSSGISGVGSWVSQDDKVKYILGFNEPNFKDQANMTPSQAAAAWPQLQAIADQYNLKLVSPAVNYCGNCVSENGIVYNNPFDWLDDFFTACVDCRVDYIALHWYGGGNSMSSYIDDARKYGKPIWVTEYASWDNSSAVTAEGQKNYLAGTTNFLERDPDVFRYSWFIGRTDQGQTAYPYIDLYAGSGQMTALGQLYLDIPVYDSSFVNEVPGQIEAEEYHLQSGLFGELTNDVDGLMNIGYTDSGDWLEYKILVAETGDYYLTTRYAGTSAGRFDVYIDGIKTTTVNTTNTGSWQSWASVTNSINLDAGEHLLKLVVVTKGFNLNWIKFDKGTFGINELSLQQLKAEVFPNPITEKKFNIIFKSFIADDLTIQIIDMTGKTVFTKKAARLNGKEIGIELCNYNELSKGIYTLSVKSKTGYLNKKIVLF